MKKGINPSEYEFYLKGLDELKSAVSSPQISPEEDIKETFEFKRYSRKWDEVPVKLKTRRERRKVKQKLNNRKKR